MIKNFFTTNIWLKMASLILAIVLWFFVILSGRTSMNMEIPIEYLNLPTELELVDPPETINVHIEGQERVLKNISYKDVSAEIDLSQEKGGRTFIPLSIENIKMPKSLSIINIEPETISLMMEKELKKAVSVKPVVVGLPEKGYAIVEITVSPRTIVIEGPESVVSKTYFIKTEPVDINGISSNLRIKANLNLSDTNIKKSSDKAEINIFVSKIE